MRYVLLLLLTVACVQVNAQARKLSPAEARSDLNQLRGTLEECAPGYTNYAPADSLRSWFDRTGNRITDSLAVRDFWLLTRQLVARVRCAHTTVSLPVNYVGKPAAKLSLSLLVSEDQRVFRLRSTGDTVLSINGRPVHEIYSVVGRLVNTDGFSPGLRRFVFERYAAQYYQVRFGRTDTLRLLLRNGAGQTKEQRITAKTPTDSADTYLRGIAHRTLQSSDRIATYETADGSTIMQLRIVGNWTDRWRLARVFRELRRRPNPRLVLDLRGNTGGRLRTARWLLRHLLAQPAQLRYERYAEPRPFASSRFFTNGGYVLRHLHHLRLALYTRVQRKGKQVLYTDELNPARNRYAGPLAVLVDGGTASAASLTAAYLYDQQRGMLFGQETGGGGYRSGGLTVPTARLTNSGVRVEVPFFQVIHQLQGTNQGRGVLPNQRIEAESGRDVVMQRALDWITGAARQAGETLPVARQ